MPFYPFSEPNLREGLDALRLARYRLAAEAGKLTQMTDQQVADHYGFTNATQAGLAKAELLSDIGKFLNRDTNIDAAEMDDALVQMLNQFG